MCSKRRCVRAMRQVSEPRLMSLPDWLLRLCLVCVQAKHARMLAASDAPPSMEEIAQFNIILFISIALVLISYFSMMAMVNMDVGSDSLLYSKSKSD